MVATNLSNSNETRSPQSEHDSPDNERHSSTTDSSTRDEAGVEGDTRQSWHHAQAPHAIFPRESNPEKAQVFSNVADGEVSSHSKIRAWKASLWRVGPLSGLCAMLFAMASILAALGVLVGSNGSPVEHWAVPPSTYLAVCTAAANLAVRYACIQGVVIAWWYRAMQKDGSSLAKLHYTWRSGTTLVGALTAGRNMGLLGIACIFSTLIVIDGPLLQRASVTNNVHFSNDATNEVPLSISMAPELPRDTFGRWATQVNFPWSYSFNNTVPVPTGNGTASNNVYLLDAGTEMAYEVEKLLFNGNLPDTIRGCPDTCETTIRAPALAVIACEERVIPANYTTLPAPNRKEQLFLVAAPRSQTPFLISIGLDVSGENESIWLITGYAKTNDCVGELTYRACSLASAIGEYNVMVRDNNSIIQNFASPRIIDRANNTAVNRAVDPTDGSRPSTLALTAYLGWVAAETVVQWWNPTQFLGGPAQISNQFKYNAKSWCPSYNDPQAFAFEKLNQLMVFSGAVVASQSDSKQAMLLSRMDPGLSINTTGVGHKRGMQTVFQTDYWYFVAAAVVEIVCIGLIAPTYYGWWTIGRPVSFSPVEIAKAFEAPVLADINSNATARNIAKTAGDRQIQYGATTSQDVALKLAFRGPAAVEHPSNGTYFGV